MRLTFLVPTDSASLKLWLLPETRIPPRPLLPGSELLFSASLKLFTQGCFARSSSIPALR